MSKSTATVAPAVLAALTAVCVNGQPASVKDVQNYMNLHTRSVKDTLGKLATKGVIARVEAGVYMVPQAESKKVTKKQIVHAFITDHSNNGLVAGIKEISDKTGVGYGTTNQYIDQLRKDGTIKSWKSPTTGKKGWILSESVFNIK